MNVFLARQPIFDSENRVVAYEILFRNSDNNFYTGSDGDSATLDVIVNTFYSLGVEYVTGGKKAFINFTEELLKKEVATVLPPEILTIEILENIEPTSEVISACRNLKNKGYTLVLDDFVFHEKYRELIELADIIKVDFTITKGIERKKIIEKIGMNKMKFLAEKVETVEEYKEAKEYGYSYFQGYFFSKPVMLAGKDIPKNEILSIKIMKQLNSRELDYRYLENLIMSDISIYYKLLKYINSPYWGVRAEVKSIKQAIVLLGEKNLVKWLYMIIMGNINNEKPDEIVNFSLIRAKFAENICIGLHDNTELSYNAYVMGMVSLMDSILNVSMESIIEELGLPDEVNLALKGEENYLNNVLRLVSSYESGKWDEVYKYSKKVNVDFTFISQAYIDALFWSNNM
ncbi:EAL and HDOD domain-containing protein [Clostridium akagii]|uniref:EAL and HDOD domain-containing protein n=1 Tax=Clostridium akagii TaxID=91623 RepID=UPI00047E6A82|nr:EAL domain-containing protein [Clostridium akagii]